MMKYVFTFLIVISVVFGIFTGNINQVSNSAISECTNAVELMVTLIGAMAFWGGMMRIAEKSGITNAVSRLFRYPAKFLFKGLDLEDKAFKAITMNLTANLLGLGNAATPLGITAINELAKEENAGDTATDNMIMLVVLNTASIQLLPTTVAALRLAHGAETPLDVLPAILIASVASVAAGIACAKLFSAGRNAVVFARKNRYGELQ